MSLSLFPSPESLSRPRITVALLSATAALSCCYLAYRTTTSSRVSSSTNHAPLRRSNAVRRDRRRSIVPDGHISSSDASDASENISVPGEDIANVENLATLPDADTVVGAPAPVAEEWYPDASLGTGSRAGHNIVHLLFRVSEDNARRTGCVHRGCQCNSCGMVPIRGVRYRCANCADFDLCESCESQGMHTKTHIFYKIRVPAPPFGPRQMQPVWYTGDPDSCRRNLDRVLLGRLTKETGLERPELEALWEQWTFMANTEWRDDPDELCVTMDRKTFERCLVPTGGARHAAPNLIHERMFHFYDTNGDDQISFPEFLNGLAYRNRKDKLTKVFEGYDLDGDGFVDRKDFLRMYRAYYVLFKQMHKDILEGLEDQLLSNTEASQLIASRQPLSSLFGREGRIPSAEGGLRAEGKTYRRDGHVDMDEGYEHATIDDKQDTARREEILTSLFAWGDDLGRARNPWTTSMQMEGGGWQTLQPVSISEDRSHWVTLLEPPTTLEMLPELLAGNHILDDYDDDFDAEDDAAEVSGAEAGPGGSGQPPTESERRAQRIARDRRRAPKLDKKRRDMARAQLHDRWKRRQFYLDEAEGGRAPEDWHDDEDVLAGYGGSASTLYRRHSETSLAPDAYARNLRSGVANGKAPETWPEDEDDAELLALEHHFMQEDAGKEILYQVTQQAFNELLDTIFKEHEDVAVRAAETRAERARWKHLIDEIDEAELDGRVEEEIDEEEETRLRGRGQEEGEKDIVDKTLDELLVDTGYTVEDRDANDFSRGNGNPFSIAEEPEDVAADEAGAPLQEQASGAHFDPTMPQFRPNAAKDLASRHAEPPGAAEEAPHVEQAPSHAQLVEYKRLTLAENVAAERDGWAKLTQPEFELAYRAGEKAGHRLDYIGSWIDFCIP